MVVSVVHTIRYVFGKWCQWGWLVYIELAYTVERGSICIYKKKSEIERGDNKSSIEVMAW